MASLVRPASTALAIVTGLSIAPWLLFALLLPLGQLSWVGFGFDGAVLALLTLCRTKATPLPWPRATWQYYASSSPPPCSPQHHSN